MCDYRSYQPTPEEQEDEPKDDPADPLKNWKATPTDKKKMENYMAILEDCVR